MAQSDQWWVRDVAAAGAPTAEERKTAVGISSTEASTARTRALTPSEVRKAETDAQLAEYKLEEARAEAAERQRKSEQMAAGLRDSATEIADVIAAALAAKRLSQTGLFATGFGSETARSISDATPAGEVAGLVDTIGANTAFDRLQEMREQSPTGGALGNVTELELKLLKSSIANIDPTKGDAAFQRSMDVVVDRYLDVYRKLGGDPGMIGERFELRAGAPLPKGLLPPSATKPAAAEDKAPAPGGAQESTTELRTGAGDKYVTEESKRVTASLQQAFDRGASKEELLGMAAEAGMTIPAANLDAIIDYRDKGGKGAQLVPTETERPLSSQLIGAAAESPVGAYAIGAGGALTGGLMDEAVGMLQGEEAQKRARFAREFSQAESPVASLLGEMTGTALASVPAVRGAMALAPGITGARAALLGETALGAVTGAGEADEGSRLGGAALGGLLGAAGGALPGVTSRVLSPRTPEAVQTLRRAGVRDMSVGQVLGVPEIEAGMAGVLPGGGEVAIRAQRQAFEQFQDAYVNDALKNIGATLPRGLRPTKRMKEAQRAFGDAYDAARSQMTVRPDADMWRDISTFRQRLASEEFSEDAAARLDKLLRDQIQRRVQGPVGGDEYKSLYSLLGKRRAAFAKQGNAEMADGVGELQQIIDRNARRHSPPEAVDLMDRADRGYAILTRAEEAARNLGNMPGEFTPQQVLDAVRKGDISQRSRAFVRGEARGQERAEAGVEGLGKAPPTEPTRIERGLGLTGSALGAQISIPINVALGLANAPGVRQMLNTAIAGERPAVARSVAELIRRKPEYLAAVGGAGTLGALAGPTGLRARPESVEELRARYGYDPEDLDSIGMFPNAGGAPY